MMTHLAAGACEEEAWVSAADGVQAAQAWLCLAGAMLCGWHRSTGPQALQLDRADAEELLVQPL